MGIADATAVQIGHASQLINSYIGKPRGLLWSPDAAGNPAWMTLATPTRSFKLADDVQPGAAITIYTNYGSFGDGDIGSAVVLDRKNIPETCVIAAASGNTITLSTQFAHAAGSTVEFGLTLGEEPAIAYDGLIRLAARPVARILGITGSYRGNSIADSLLAIGRDTTLWNPFPLDQCEIDDLQGTCWMLPGTVRGGFSRVRVGYVAGWGYDALPYDIKLATAAIVRNGIDTADLPGNIIMARSGNAMLQRASATKLDPDIMAMLAKYRNYRL